MELTTVPDKASKQSLVPNSCCVYIPRITTATMGKQQRKKASRKGYRSHLTRLMHKVDQILESEERLSQRQIATLHSSIEQFSEQGALLRGMDTDIVATIHGEDKLEAEIVESAAIQEAISDKISQIRSVLEPRTTPTLNVSAPAFVPSELTTTVEVVVATTHREHVSCLPKLHLPTFSGSPLDWQGFWDSFHAAVHSNPVLDDVQKLNYLRTQLLDEGSHAISGFTLTSANYQEAKTLLQERFGQTNKIIHAHMRALSNLPKPSNTVSTLRHFYDSIESHIRGLSALGTSEDSYSALLATIMYDKLPTGTRQHMARFHTSQEWTHTELRESVLTEIKVLEAGRIVETTEPTGNLPSAMTVSFYAGASNHTSRHREQAKPVPCIFTATQLLTHLLPVAL